MAGSRSGGQILVDQLKIHGARLAFCVPGESYLAALDALYDAADHIRLVTCRHEGPACHMAEAHGKLTGRPGLCFVARGPGASHAMVGIHTAFQDSTPLILFVGLIARGTKEREAFQEIDLKAMFGHTTKWTAEITDPRRIPEMVSRAFHLAVAGRPGPVGLGLPEDMLTETCVIPDVGPFRTVRPSPDAAAIDALYQLLAGARRPLVMVGGGGWTAQAVADLEAFAGANDLSVCASFRCQDKFDNRHPGYIGDCSLGISPALAERILSCDLLIAVGARLGELTTQGYSLVKPPVPAQKLIHVFPDPDELGRVYQGALLIPSGMEAFAAAARARPEIAVRPWQAWTLAARRAYLDSLVPSHPAPGPLDLGAVMAGFRDTVGSDAIITLDAGNFAGWVQRYYQFSRFGSLLGPANGAMGYGIPAAISAKLTEPDRPVYGFVGDGGFLMSGQELATAVQNRLKLVIIVVNNGLYGTIRMHQERDYPGRYPATTLVNPDFAAYARAFGAHGETVAATADFAPAFARAQAAEGPAVLELRIDPEQITTRTTLTALRRKG